MNSVRRKLFAAGFTTFVGAAAVAVLSARRCDPASRTNGAEAGDSGGRLTADRTDEADQSVDVSNIDDEEQASDADLASPAVTRSEPDRTGGILVSVTAFGNEPLAGAEVFIVPDQAIESEDLPRLHPEAVVRGNSTTGRTSDSVGRTSVRAEAGEYLIIVRHEGYGTQITPTRIEPAVDRSIAIELQPTIGIHGTVISAESSTPLGGIRILTMPWQGQSRDPDGSREQLPRLLAADVTVSDSDGRFSFHRTPEGQHVLWCFFPGFPPAIVENAVPSAQELVIRIGGDAKVTGIVVDEDGAPIAGAEVNCATIGEWPPPVLQETMTDADGGFRIRGLPAGPMRLRVLANGFAVARPTIVLPLAEDEVLEIELEPEARFSGHVVDHRGKPVEGALVLVQDRALNTEPSRMVTEPDGSFWSIYVPAGHPLEVIVSREDTWTQRFLGMTAPKEDVVLVLLPEATLEGQVVDDDGDPVQEFELLVTSEFHNAIEDHAVRRSPWSRFHAANGRFDLRTRPGAVQLDIRSRGFESSVVAIESVEPGAMVALEPIRMQRGRVVNGRVVDALAAPIEGARVSLAGRTRGGEAVHGEWDGIVATDASGMFSMAQAGDGPFDLIVSAEGFGPLLLRDQIIQDFPRDVVLEAPGAVEGVVHVPWRRPETIALMIVRPVASRVERFEYADATGRFRFEGLGRGLHWVELADRWVQGELESPCLVSSIVDVIPGETVFVELRSGRGCLVDGEVTSPWEGVRPDRFQVDFVAAGKGGERLVAVSATDRSGLYSLGLIPPGDYVARLRSREPGWIVAAEIPVVLRESTAHERIDFQVEGTLITGRVRSASGEPIVADVRLVDPTDGRVVTSARTDRSGGYSFLTRESESALAWIEAPGFAECFGDRVDLTRGSAMPLEHLLAPEARVGASVVDDRGAPLGEVALDLEGSERPRLLPSRTLASDASGRATFTRLGAGPYELHGRRRGYVAAASSRFVLGEGESANVRLTLVRCGTLEVSVRDEGGAPIVDREVAVALVGSESGEDSWRRSTAGDGRARFTDLAPGRYRIEVESGAPVEIGVEPGGLVKQDVVVQKR